MPELPLRRRDGSVKAYAVVDDSDYEWASQFRWSVNQYGTVYRAKWDPERKKNLTFLLHRELMGLEKGEPLEVDHIDRNPLNNSRANLRVCTHAENRQNNGSNRNSSSQYRGVWWHKREGKWAAGYKVDGQPHHVGYFADEGEAHRAVSEARGEAMPFSVEEPCPS